MPTSLIAVAHAGEPLRPHDLWTAWTFEPWTVAALVISGGLYARGLRRLWHAAGRDRGVRINEAAAFALGWLIVAVSLMSPLHALGGVLLSAHMTQHELLMTIAAPLLVLGKPVIAFVWALRPAWRRTTGQLAEARPVAFGWRTLTHPLVAFLVHGAAVWVWHAPALYDAAVASEAMHAFQHVSFFATALLFWWVALNSRAARGGVPASVGMLFATTLHTGALGALLALSSTLAYDAYAATTAPWGLTPISDQQLGGLIMWVPGGIAYVIAAMVLVARLLRDGDARAVRRNDRLSRTVLVEPSAPEPRGIV
jgi:putative membrane protein